VDSWYCKVVLDFPGHEDEAKRRFLVSTQTSKSLPLVEAGSVLLVLRSLVLMEVAEALQPTR
jgi:hypothetical protein